MTERTAGQARIYVAHIERRIQRYKEAAKVLGLSSDSGLHARVNQVIFGMRYIQAGLLIAAGELPLDEALKSLDIPGFIPSAEKWSKQGEQNG